MTIPLLRDLEQRWREEAQHDEARSSTARSRRRTRRTSQHSDELAAVRRTLEARLEGLERHEISGMTIHYPGGEVAGEQRDEVKPDGHWLLVADLEAALVAAQEDK